MRDILSQSELLQLAEASSSLTPEELASLREHLGASVTLISDLQQEVANALPILSMACSDAPAAQRSQPLFAGLGQPVLSRLAKARPARKLAVQADLKQIVKTELGDPLANNLFQAISQAPQELS